jgi:hypothetical protein
MQIQIVEENVTNFKLLYLDNRSRLPSVTDVKFITKDLIIVAHRYASKLYLIKLLFDNTCEILDTIVLTYPDTGKLTYTESFVYKDNTVYCINYIEYLIKVDIIDNKFVWRSIEKINQNNTHYHGIEIFNNTLYLSPIVNQINEKCEEFATYNLVDKKFSFLSTPNLPNDIKIKDILFVNSDLVVLSVLNKTENTLYNKKYIANSYIGLYTFPNFILLDKVDIENCQLDLGTMNDNKFYVCGSTTKGDYIYYGEVKDNKIVNFGQVEAEPFPHGIDIYGDMIAYTSYGNDSVYIQKLEDLIPE